MEVPNTAQSSQAEATPLRHASLSRLVGASAVVACVLVLVGIWLLLVPGETASALAVFGASLACGGLSYLAWQERAAARGEHLVDNGALDLNVLATLLVRNREVIAVGAVTALAALLRFWALGEIPDGIHGDEAQIGMDAWRILDQGWIGVYTRSALGQPAGTPYLTAPFLEVFGSTSWSLRLPFAIVGAAAVPLTFVLFRMQANRTIGLIAALLVATSLWHIHYSRVALQPISYPTVELIVLIFWTLAMRDGRWRWFLLAGATLGLGIYTYNVYPIFVVAFALWVVLYTLMERRGDEFCPWATKVAAAALVSFVVAVPLFLYMLDESNGYFDHYNQYYESYSILASDAYEQGDTGERANLIAEQVKRWIGAYAWDGVPDYVDGASANGEAMFDKLTLALLVAGAGYATWTIRRTPHLMAIVLVLVIPLTSVLQTNSTYRGALGVVPFTSFIVALPLAWVWEGSQNLNKKLNLAMRFGAIAAIAFIAFTSIHTYFWKWDDSGTFRFVYAQEISEASEYMATAPGNPYVYFLSDRWSFNYETRQYLAPNVRGEDRASKFAQRQDLSIDRSRDSLFVLLAPHFEKADELRRLYRGGREYTKLDGDRTLFIAYFVPADATDTPTQGERPTEVGNPTVDALARDDERRHDLAVLAKALQSVFREKGQYPSTQGNVQSACRYKALDQLCFLEPEVGEVAFNDPRGDQDRYGYWYKSDGETFSLFASMEGSVDASETCPPERHLQASNVRNILCVRSP